MDGSLEELGEVSVKIYIYLLTSREPKGVREISRELGIPVSTVHYNIKKLEEKGLVRKDNNGYIIARVVPIKGFIVIGRKLIHKFFIYSLFFIGILMGEIIKATISDTDIDDFLITAIVSLAGFSLFFYEAIKIHIRLK
jgi:predicted DNA-binding transcriptional regulator